MKKKIVIGVFSVLIAVTVVGCAVAAVSAYAYEMDPANGVDIFEGFGAVLIAVVGGLAIFYELNLFYTVYYFVVRPKTIAKSILNVLSNLTLLLIAFTDSIAHFLFQYVSPVFGEEVIVLLILVLLYVILRIACAAAPAQLPSKEES